MREGGLLVWRKEAKKNMNNNECHLGLSRSYQHDFLFQSNLTHMVYKLYLLTIQTAYITFLLIV